MSDISTYGGRPLQTPAVWAVLGLWAAGMATLARNDALRADPGSLPLPVMMQQWPLAMVPGFLSPTFIILHLMAWKKLRQEM